MVSAALPRGCRACRPESPRLADESLDRRLEPIICIERLTDRVQAQGLEKVGQAWNGAVDVVLPLG